MTAITPDTGGGEDAPVVPDLPAEPSPDPMSELLATRRARILGDTDLSLGRTLEVGPLAAACITREMADVRYVDVVDRDGLVAHYRDDTSVDTALIPEIDYWLTREDGSVGTLAEAVAPGAPFHRVVASHVIEHVPDMIGWLRDVAEVLVDDGELLLAVPDLRFCFDARRPPTTVGQVVQAHLDGDRTPSFRAVYDHARTVVPFPAWQAWAGVWPPEQRLNPMSGVRARVERQQNGEYVDCHVWCLTPVRFVDLLVDLLELGLVDFAVQRVTATPHGHLEFYATLRRIPRTAPPGAVPAALDELATIRSTLPDEERTWPHQVREGQLTERIDELERRLAQSEERVAELVRARDRAVAQRDDARAKRDAARARLRRARAQTSRARAQRDRARARAARLAALLEQERSRLGRRLARTLRRWRGTRPRRP